MRIFKQWLWFGLICSPCLLVAPHLHAAQLIDWQLENPFRFFQNSEHTQLHRAVYNALPDPLKTSPIVNSERLLSKANSQGWAEDVFQNTCWSRSQATHYNCQGTIRDYINPTSHVVHVRVGDEQKWASLGDNVCTWIVKDNRQKIIQKVQQKCVQLARLEIPYPSGARVSLSHQGKEIGATFIEVKDILVVGMGDSFASGEGNPDKVVQFSPNRHAVYSKGKREAVDVKALPTRVGNWQQVADKNFMKQRAKWLGQSCHRSLYSHQMRTALQLAIEHRKRSVTFISVACAGAEVTKGLFLLEPGNEWSPNPPNQSQISLIANATCGRSIAPLGGFPRAYGLNGELPILDDIYLRKCPRNKARPIDLLLLSIGGNDVGFSRLVANVVIDDQLQLKTLGGWMGKVYSPKDAMLRLIHLRRHYKVLNRALHHILHIPWEHADRIVLTAYPNMSFLEQGSKICQTGQEGMTVAPVFDLSAKRAQAAEKFAEQLNEVMRAEAGKNKWSFVDSHRAAFKSHGICAKDDEKGDALAEDLRLPVWKKGVWEPYNPADYPPYASRARWFRTPNDAYMTAHLHISGPVINKLFKFKSLNVLQLVIAGTYSGAFHPTAEGQAVIGDAVVQKAREVLAKYGQD